MVPITDFYCIKTWVAHFLDCTHKYMMKTRAPPDRVGVLVFIMYLCVQSRKFEFFRDGRGPFKCVQKPVNKQNGGK